MASLWTNIAPKSVITPPQNGATFDPSSVMSSLFPIDMVPSAVLDYSVREHSLNSSTPALLPQADLKSRPREKKTKGRVKIKMEFIDDKQKRLTSFSKRKAGLLKKASELAVLTRTEVLVLVASETDHVYHFATPRLQPMIASVTGQALIHACLNSSPPCTNDTARDDRLREHRMNLSTGGCEDVQDDEEDGDADESFDEEEEDDGDNSSSGSSVAGKLNVMIKNGKRQRQENSGSVSSSDDVKKHSNGSTSAGHRHDEKS